MIIGHFRGVFPRVTLELPGRAETVSVEFIVDTGFEGELALPSAIINSVDASYSFSRRIELADGTMREQPYYKIILDWDGEPRLTEVLMLEGRPLLGAILMLESLLHSEMTPGGEVFLDPL